MRDVGQRSVFLSEHFTWRYLSDFQLDVTNDRVGAYVHPEFTWMRIFNFSVFLKVIFPNTHTLRFLEKSSLSSSNISMCTFLFCSVAVEWNTGLTLMVPMDLFKAACEFRSLTP